MTHSEFVELVERMRENQKGFFSSDRNSSQRSVYLQESRKLERQVDEEIKSFKSNQGDLFASSDESSEVH